MSTNDVKPSASRDYAAENTVPALGQVSDHGCVRIVRREGGPRVLFFGNSITRHSPAPQLGWYGDWGMAASAREKDYVHLVLAGLEPAHGRVDYCLAQAGAWERGYWQPELLEERYRPAREFAADVVIIRIGENVRKEEYAQYAFRPCVERAIRYLAGPQARVIVTDPFWFSAELHDDLQAVAQENGCVFCPLGDLSRDEANMAVGLFEHHGVSIHPGDLGMRRIADRILQCL